MMSVPEFETERLMLRAVTETDLPAYERHFVDYEVVAPLSAAVPWPYPKNGVQEYFAKRVVPRQGRDLWLWGLFLRVDPGELVGAVELWRPCAPENRGFWLGRKFWGQGLMTEAVIPITTYAFEKLGFEKLVFTNAVGNARSRRIKEKTGARLIRVEPAAFVDAAFSEREVWELSREAWHSVIQTGFGV